MRCNAITKDESMYGMRARITEKRESDQIPIKHLFCTISSRATN